MEKVEKVVIVDVECETPQDFRAFKQVLATSPRIGEKTLDGRFIIHHEGRFNELLKVCAGRILPPTPGAASAAAEITRVTRIPTTVKYLLQDLAHGTDRVFYGEGTPYGWRYASKRGWVERIGETQRGRLTEVGWAKARELGVAPGENAPIVTKV